MSSSKVNADGALISCIAFKKIIFGKSFVVIVNLIHMLPLNQINKEILLI
jgi:hypothetical protein